MIRIIISILIFYFGAALIVATLAENIFSRTNRRDLRFKIKNSLTFCMLGSSLFLVGWASWPENNKSVLPGYYIVETQKVGGLKKVNVRIKKKLTVGELALIVENIKANSGEVNYSDIRFFLPEQSYKDIPYSHYNYVNDHSTLDRFKNKLSNHPYGLTIIEERTTSYQ